MELKAELTKVVKDKEGLKKDLTDLKIKYMALIYGGLSRREQIKAIHKRLYDETINQKEAGRAVSGRLLTLAYKTANSLKKKTEDTAFVTKTAKAKYGAEGSMPIVMGAFVFGLMKEKKTDKAFGKEIVKEADEKEAEQKDNAIDKVLEANLSDARDALGEKLDADKVKIFYLASAHKDSATDHAPYQGKMYVDENWEGLPMTYALRNAISYYIKAHNVKSVQWVMGRPIWFITRPNCRHYFQNLSVKEVLATPKTALIERYNLKTPIGDRKYLQTMKHSTSKEWYEDIRNAQLLVKSYKERLEMHKAMYAENPIPLLKQAIEKDRMLIRKWETYINERNARSR